MDKNTAHAIVEKANKKMIENGGWPETEAEFREWIGKPAATDVCAKITSKKLQNQSTQYTTHKSIGGNRRYYLGTDLAIAQARVDSANKRWEANGYCWPDTAEEFREWLGVSGKKRSLHTIKLAKKGPYNFAKKSINRERVVVSLGTDPAIAQARVDQANARWEANGYKWPDTAEEFREWLTLPPPS